MLWHPDGYEPRVKAIEEEIYANKDRKDVPDKFKFDTVTKTGMVKLRVFKDDLIFKSQRSINLFASRKHPFKSFTADREGLPLFAFRTKKPFFVRRDYVGFLFYRYEILKNGDFPEESDYEVKGECDGFTLFKVLFCTVKVKKTSYYRNKERISHILELNFGKKEDFRILTLVRCSEIRSVYVVEDKKVIMKWVFTSESKFNLNSSLFIIKAAIGCLPEVDDSIEDIPKFDWDSCPTIGCMCRTKEALFQPESRKDMHICPQLFLGETGPPHYNESSVPWLTKMNICISVLINFLEYTDFMSWMQDN
ncbi:CDA_G0016270.mRNA.1.CDS.1 [Saccharomyces cerevisiae]|nr:CDA_G0016270.mRNA.1.CDS.1 [Saccharomyces cerevisiae]CAI7269398.1 CDA_G0016270.mRNA.1.CDS.1 [Saccharomyces cerevisiae]